MERNETFVSRGVNVCKFYKSEIQRCEQDYYYLCRLNN